MGNSDSSINPRGTGGHRSQVPIGGFTRQTSGKRTRPGGEPWKELVWHNAGQTKLPHHGKGPSTPDVNWLLAAPKLKRLKRSMWRSIVEAWLNVRPGLTKTEPTTKDEILRQPLFGNPSILSARGTPLGVSGRSEGCAFAHSRCTRIRDLWNSESKNWKSLLELGMSRHAANIRHREIIVASIPWRFDGLEELRSQRRLDSLEELGGQRCLDSLEEQGGQRRLDGLEDLGSQRRLDGLEELGGCIQVGDWIASPTPDTGNPLDWVYLVLAKDKNTTKVLEFKRTSPGGRIQLTSNQAHTMSTLNQRLVRVLAQENPEAPLKVARDPPTPGKKGPVFWIFDSEFIQDLPWDPREWHWQPHPPLGDAPFFGYLAKRGYNTIRKPTQTSSMTNFLEELNLRNSSTAQLTARIWHSTRPRKVGTLIWFTLNKGLPVGTWFRTMGLPSICKVCDANSKETPQHCFLECFMAQRAWEAFKRIWSEWQAPHDLDITWPFVLLGEATMEREDNTPRLLAYHAGGFTCPRQPLDILRSLIVYTLWTERLVSFDAAAVAAMAYVVSATTASCSVQQLRTTTLL
ncbi:unnamed protein product [Sphagnum balticum]